MFDKKSNRSIVRKAAVDSSVIASSGRLNPTQSDKFIDYMTDESAFLKDIRTIKMPGPEYDLDFIGVSSRIIRTGVESTEPTNQPGIETSRKKLKTTEVILPQDISLTFLEDNIERVNAEDTVARLLAQQFANDVCDLAINGDSTATGTPDSAFLNIGDGFVKLAKESTSAHTVDIGASVDYKGEVFRQILEAMPNKFKRNLGELRFYVSPSVAQAYIDQLTTRETAWADSLIQTGSLPKYKGVTIMPVEYWPDDCLILTPRLNLATGIQRAFTFDRERVPRKRIVEFTMTSRIDPAKIVHDDALVVAYNVPDASA
jgi:hypothetical protein